MDFTHIHLVITHLPIFGTVIGAFVLIHGILSKNNQTKMAAYNVFILSAIGAAIAYFTGEAAEETVEQIGGISEMAIENHEEFASFAFASLVGLGVLSIIGNVLNLIKSSLSKPFAVFMLVCALISFGMASYTGFLGGKIRHTEIGQSFSQGLNQDSNANPVKKAERGDD